MTMENRPISENELRKSTRISIPRECFTGFLISYAIIHYGAFDIMQLVYRRGVLNDFVNLIHWKPDKEYWWAGRCF